MPLTAADKLNRLPDLRQDAQEILRVVMDRDAPLADLTRALTQDPGTTARVLSAANAGFIAGSQAAGSVDDAALRLGMSRVRILAAATLLASRMAPDACPAFDCSGYWFRAISVAMCVSKLVNYVEVEVPAASTYLAGLLHGVGLLVNALTFPEAMDQVLGQHAADPSPGLSLRQYQALGFDHHVAGAHALRSWGIGGGAPETAEHYADPDYDGSCMRLVALVRLCVEWDRAGYECRPAGPLLEGIAGTKLDNIGLSCQCEIPQVELAARRLARLDVPAGVD